MANLAVVPLGQQGRISVYMEHRSELVVDVVGYFTPVGAAVAAGRYVGLTPGRILDSRRAWAPGSRARSRRLEPHPRRRRPGRRPGRRHRGRPQSHGDRRNDGRLRVRHPLQRRPTTQPPRR